MILTQHPEWKTFALEMDTFAGSIRRHSDGKVIDGDPIHSGNIAGFINCTVGTQPKRRANCEWVFVEGPFPAPYGQTYHEDHCLVIELGPSDQEMSCLHTMSGIKIPPFLNYVLC
jgi:hypothetical protein